VPIQQPHFGNGNYITLLALVSSMFTAIAMIGLHRLQDIDTRAIVVHFSGVALLFVLASFVIFERHLPLTAVLDGPCLLMLLGVGLAATSGQMFLTKAFAAGPPAKVSVVGLTQIVYAMALEV